MINVSVAALDKHLEHGDGIPGKAVPGMEGHEFDEVCNVIEVVQPIHVTSAILN